LKAQDLKVPVPQDKTIKTICIHFQKVEL